MIKKIVGIGILVIVLVACGSKQRKTVRTVESGMYITYADSSYFQMMEISSEGYMEGIINELNTICYARTKD